MSINATDACYLAQLGDCESKVRLGFGPFSLFMCISSYAAVILGLTAFAVSIFVRTTRDRARGIGRAFAVSQFEWFLLLFTLSCLASAVALSLSYFVNISSLLFFSLYVPRNVFVYVAIMVFVDSVLRSNTLKDRGIETLRKRWLPLLMLPLVITNAMHVYQGYLSDLVHYRPDLNKSSQYSLVTFLDSCLWILCFILLLIFLLVARKSFRTYLSELVPITTSIPLSGLTGRSSTNKHPNSNGYSKELSTASDRGIYGSPPQPEPKVILASISPQPTWSNGQPSFSNNPTAGSTHNLAYSHTDAYPTSSSPPSLPRLDSAVTSPRGLWGDGANLQMPFWMRAEPPPVSQSPTGNGSIGGGARSTASSGRAAASLAAVGPSASSSAAVAAAAAAAATAAGGAFAPPTDYHPHYGVGVGGGGGGGIGIGIGSGYAPALAQSPPPPPTTTSQQFRPRAASTDYPVTTPAPPAPWQKKTVSEYPPPTSSGATAVILPGGGGGLQESRGVMFPSLFPLGADGHSVGTSSSSSQTRQVPEGLAQAVTFATAPRPDSDRLVEALKNGLATMNWMIWGIVVFVIFSAIFAVLFSAVGLKGYMFHFTLFFNWCLGFFVGIAIFLAAIVRSAKQYGRLVSATTRGRVPSSGDGSRS